MKYKTFRAVALVVGGLAAAGAVAGAYVACSGGDKTSSSASAAKTESKPSTKPTTPAPPSTPTPAPTSTPTSPSDDASALRPMDQKILEKVHAGVADKMKDVFKTEAYKVNLYKEDGKVRAKIDLDRDEKADEKWDFDTDGGKEVVKRRVSTKDDENYDVEYRLQEGKWVKKG